MNVETLQFPTHPLSKSMWEILNFWIVDNVLKKVNDLVEEMQIQNSQYVADGNKNDCPENSGKFGPRK